MKLGGLHAAASRIDGGDTAWMVALVTFLLRGMMGLRVHPVDEAHGLDMRQHGESIAA